ncbi:MAG TPA: hypothetical protein VFS60_04185 [Thermoanaerobaculia bacterium]|nr:hypothetical protein [Thermoanaerobaculia bacterium]
MVEGARRQKTPNEIALQILLAALTDTQIATITYHHGAAVRIGPSSAAHNARLLAGWNFWEGRGEELLRLSPPLKAKLLAHVMASDDQDKRDLALVGFAP